MKDKNILTSKKFAAFFFSMAVIAGVLVVGVIKQVDFNVWTAVFMGIGILGLTSLAIGYIINQKALDIYLKSVNKLIEKDENKNTND